MEDFACGKRPKRAPPQLLFDYFASVSDLHKYVLEQQAIVRETQRDWLDIPLDRKDGLLDGAFQVPDLAALPYPETVWGKRIVSSVSKDCEE